jgi:2,4-dienoyl-CoA reductase (NADPH2)
MANKQKFEKLSEPCKIGRIQTRNRLVKTAAQTYFFEPGERRVGDRAKAFYEALARGGAGLIIVETPAMESPLKEKGDCRFRLDNDKYIKEVSELTGVIHKYGCPTFVQFYHRGPWGGVYAQMAPPVAASAVTFKSELDVHGDDPPRALTIAEIEEIIERYGDTAIRAAKAGFDGIEVNAAGDHLLSTFLSRLWNKRQDIYGPQNMENRTRFVVSIIREIKKRMGEDFPIQVLMNAMEIGGGNECLNLEEGKAIAQLLEKAGANSIQVRTHWIGQHQASNHNELLYYPEPFVPISSFPKELNWSHKGVYAWVPVTAEIKKTLSIPVMAVGGMDAQYGEMVLRQGKADLIGMTRRLFADPEYPDKVFSGRLKDIAPCTHCGNCMKLYNQPRQCRINAAFGTEQYQVEKAAKIKKVVIAGGGPAGMEAAMTAALRGHDVTLFEKSHKLGGAIPMAAMVKGTEIEDLPAIVRYFKDRITELGVKIRLGKELNLLELEALKPDVLIWAAGGQDVTPKIPGIDRRKVVKSSELHRMLTLWLGFLGPTMLRKLTRVWVPLGKRTIIIGGAIQGCQVAEFLVKRGKIVTIVDTAAELGDGLAPERKSRLFLWFKKKGVKLISGARLNEITYKGLNITDKEGKTLSLEADSVLTVMPLALNADIPGAFKDKAAEVYYIGDCANPGIIPDAIADGWKISNKI